MAHRLLVFLLVIALAGPVLLTSAATRLPAVRGPLKDVALEPTRRTPDEEALDQQKKRLSSYGQDVYCTLDDQDVPEFLMGTLSARIFKNDSKAEALAALDVHGAAFRRGPDDGFTMRRLKTDELGMTHIRMSQTYKGIPVTGGELIVHLNSENVVGINGRFVADLDLPTDAKLTTGEAANLAIVSIVDAGGVNAIVTETRSPVVFVNQEDSARLALPVRVEYTDETGLQIDDVFVDADTGLILGRHPQVWRVLHREIYDGQRRCGNIPGDLIFEEGGSSLDRAAMGAYEGVGITYDFYNRIFGRDSFDDMGSTLIATVHAPILTRTGICDPNNAAWLPGNQMAFGDGDGRFLRNVANDLDIVAHELTHGVTETEADLEYIGEPGALNEATSDILAESTSFWAEVEGIRSGSADWKIGAEAFVAGDALRYMYDPVRDAPFVPDTTDDGSPPLISSRDYYQDRYIGRIDAGGVHYNSGIANLFFYLLSQGGMHPRGKTSFPVRGIGINKARQIWFRALTVFMTPETNFRAARTATIIATAELFGADSPDLNSVRNAWEAVGNFHYNPASYFSLTAKHSLKRLTVVNPRTSDAVVQDAADNWFSWRIEPVGDGFFKLTSLTTNKCLSVSGDSMMSGATIVQSDYTGADSQEWRIEPVGNGLAKLVARHSGKALSVEGMSTADGAPAIQADYTGSDSQKWRIFISFSNLLGDATGVVRMP